MAQMDKTDKLTDQAASGVVFLTFFLAFFGFLDRPTNIVLEPILLSDKGWLGQLVSFVIDMAVLTGQIEEPNLSEIIRSESLLNWAIISAIFAFAVSLFASIAMAVTFYEEDNSREMQSTAPSASETELAYRLPAPE